MEENVTETLICKLLVQAAGIVVRRLGTLGSLTMTRNRHPEPRSPDLREPPPESLSKAA